MTMIDAIVISLTNLKRGEAVLLASGSALHRRSCRLW